MITKNRRLGKFHINSKLIREEPWLVTRIMSQCIIVRAEHLWERDGIEYVALSRHFDELSPSYIPPVYEWHAGDNGELEAIKLN